MLTIQALMHTEGKNQIGGSIWNYTTGTLTFLQRVLNWIVLSNLTAGIHASYKTTGTWGNFKNQETKRIHFPDKL